MPEMSESDLKAIISAKVRNATGYLGGALSKERIKADQYYKGDAFGNEIEGRSQVVSRDVAEAVDAMMPALMKIFTSGDEVVKFEPTNDKEEEAARQATDYVNWIWNQQNPGFSTFHTWFKDALLKKTGIVKVWWEVSDHKSYEPYKGLTDVQLQGLMADPDLEVVEGSQKDYPAPPISPFAMLMPPTGMPQGGPQAPGPGAPTPMPPQIGVPPLTPEAGAAPAPQMAPTMLHDIKFMRTEKKGKCCIYPVPPDEFLIDRRAVDADKDVGYLAHRRRSNVSELTELYPDKKKLIKDLPGEDGDGEFSQERLERFQVEDEYPYRDSAGLDPSMRVVWVIENYIKVDYDGDGVAEWRKVVIAGEDGLGGEILLNEEIDDHPFAAITPIPMPHKFYGMSIADQTQDIQLIKSTLTRTALDGLYTNLMPAVWAVKGQVDLDDLLNRRPNQVIRVTGPNAVGVLEHQPVTAEAFEMIQYMDTVREQRTGVQRFTAGPGADALNNAYTDTATGANIVETASQERLELIARIFAETGVKRAFRRVFELVCKYQDEAKTIRLRGKWIDIDPSTWNNQMDMTVHAGLGTGNKREQVGVLSNLLATDMKLMETPGMGVLVSPENVYHKLVKLAEASGLKGVEQYYTDPKNVPPQPPPPNPDVMKVQAQAQLQAQQQQADQQQAQAQLQLQAQQAQVDQQLQLQKQQSEAQTAATKLQLEARKIELAHALKIEELKAKMQLDQAAMAAEIGMKREQAQAQLGLEREKFGAQSEMETDRFHQTQNFEREKAGLPKPATPKKTVKFIREGKVGPIQGAEIEG